MASTVRTPATKAAKGIPMDSKPQHPTAGPSGGSVSVLPDFHLSLRVTLSVDVAREPSSEGPL